MEIPIEVIRNVILPFLDIKDVASLSFTCKDLYQVMNGETATIFLERDFKVDGDWSLYKTLRDKKVDYEIEVYDEYRTNMWFESKNIKGHVGISGTRMWFSPKVMTRYVHVTYGAYEVEECKFKGYEEDPDNDDFVFRFDDLEEILQGWIEMEMEHYIFTKEVTPHIAGYDYCLFKVVDGRKTFRLFTIMKQSSMK